MRLSDVIKFQKTLALAASASNSFEAEAAELAARRLVVTCNLDPTRIPNISLYSHLDFADNALLQKLRNEYREQHPVPEPIVRKVKQSLDDLDHIPFNVSGFTKYAHKKKSGRKRAVQLTYVDYENIRLLLNEGLELKIIAEKTGIKATTLNSTRAYHVRSSKWIRDSKGHFQWADREVSF